MVFVLEQKNINKKQMQEKDPRMEEDEEQKF